jgi:four and a half LIM domains protein 2
VALMLLGGRQVCLKPVVGDVYDDKGAVQCETCFFKGRDLLCTECTKPIKTQYVQFANKKRHTECFACTYCRKPLSETNARIVKTKLYCLDCSSKLYG